MSVKYPPKNAGYLSNRHDSLMHKEAAEEDERPDTSYTNLEVEKTQQLSTTVQVQH